MGAGALAALLVAGSPALAQLPMHDRHGQMMRGHMDHHAFYGRRGCGRRHHRPCR
jgi:hypothetical protein